MKKKTPIVFSLCLAAFASNAVHAQTSGLYPINFSETQRITSTTRYTNAVTLSSGDGQQTVEVNQRADRMLYIKRLDDCLFAKPGETVTAGFSFPPNAPPKGAAAAATEKKPAAAARIAVRRRPN